MGLFTLTPALSHQGRGGMLTDIRSCSLHLPTLVSGARGRVLRDVRVELTCINLGESDAFVGGKVFEKPAAAAALKAK